METDTEYLLGRKEIILNREHIHNQIFNQKILVTGAAGSIGRELVRQIISYNPSQLCLIDQWELGIYELKSEFDTYPNIEFELGNITDSTRMSAIFNDFKPQIVFHAAAYKHVSLLEDYPSEAIKNNVIGTKIIADLSLQNHVEKFVFISTDKAVNPFSNMGVSKRMGELYVLSLNDDSQSITQFIITRFGNVLGSTGSVYSIFNEQIKKGGPVTVTSLNATRYFMSHFEAAQLVLQAAAIGKGGEILVFDMGLPIFIYDLAKRMIEKSTIAKDIRIVFTGLKSGEKLHENLLFDEEKLLPTHHPKISVARFETVHKTDVHLKIALLSEALETATSDQLSSILKNILSDNNIAKTFYMQPKFASSNVFADNYSEIARSKCTYPPST